VEGDHRGVGVGEVHLVPALRTLARVERRARRQEGVVGQAPDALATGGVHRFDLGQLRQVLRMDRRTTPRWRGRGTNSTSRTQSETDALATPSSEAISTSVIPVARSSRARTCSASFPRYPTVRECIERMFDC